MIVDKRLLSVLDRALYGLELLGDLHIWPALLNHLDNRLQVAVSALEALDDIGMRVVRHGSFPILEGGYQASPRGDIEEILDMPEYRAYFLFVVLDIVPGDDVLNPNEEQMGSTTFGDATPAQVIGLAAPQQIEIDRGSYGRVSSRGPA